MKPLIVATGIALFSLSAHADTASSTLVKQFIDAYNQHSVETMVQYVADDVRWMHITGTKVEVETSSKEQFGAAMSDYFETLNNPKATIVELITSAHYVSTVERVEWSTDGEQLSQCSIGNFRVENGKIAEFWYLPAHTCDEATIEAAETEADMPTNDN
ncbi:nuclear transport factor 2 family protein [Shewanella sp. Isolate11]|uniref:nuclear transport factor 2 family protein n=1 Tax=Shewanella sp. Isolate11 TaxID=2908530 RepID=UPI001EFD9541|nr:nuclear transport factor 2 family protein [Shewanella sp. Isolate11]MCG9697781.1 nuclear transport factor 2 family protein [Shewanella sp. Isolate11]